MEFCPKCQSMIMHGTTCPACGFNTKNGFYFEKIKIGIPKSYISDKNHLKKNYDEFLELIINKDQVTFSKEEIFKYFDKIIDIANDNFIKYEKNLISKDFSNYLTSLDEFIDDNEILNIKSKFERPYFNFYVELKMEKRIKKHNENYINKFKDKILVKLPEEYISHSQMIQFQKENNINFDLDLIIEEHNNNFIETQMEKNKDFFENIDNKSLDKNQKIAVLTDDDNTQIVAGAGTGKTLTIQAKVKYLIEKQDVSPQDILCISFSNSARDDLAKKLNRTIDVPVEVRTFHSLGYSILGINGHDKEVPKNEISELIENYFKESINNNPKLIKDFIEFFCYYFNVVHINADNLKLETIKSKLNALNEFDEFLSEYLQIDNVRKTREYVSNISDLIISNYLFIHNIPYRRSKQAIFKDKNYDKYINIFSDYFFSDMSDYIPNDVKLEIVDIFDDEFGDKLDIFPSFYLPQNNIYIDLLNVGPNWENTLYGENKQKTKEKLEFINNLNQKYKTKLLTVFDYGDDIEGLLENINKQLVNNQIKVNDLDYELLFKNLILNNKMPEYNIFIKTVESFINLFKGNAQNIDSDGNDISKKMFELFHKENTNIYSNSFEKRNKFYLKLIEEIYELYQENLEDNDYIDFNDMINDAVIELRNNPNIHNYKYVIVDEYQDTSHTRYNLLKEVQNVTGTKVVVVGDDWQSIYGFTGCDVSLFSKFENYFENPKMIKIDVTHRNSQKLINVVGEFIQENKSLIEKELKSDYVTHEDPIKIYEYSSRAYEVLALITILNKISEEKKDAHVLILGRNNKDIYEISCNEIFDMVQFNDYTTIEYNNCPDLDIEFRTVHKSKGLEADYVIVLNLNNQIDGFPNKIVNDPILDFVNNKQTEEVDYAEERRLFYVALTRTKNDVYLFYKSKRPSKFITSITGKIGVRYLDYTFSNNDVMYINSLLQKKFEVIETDNICPICNIGQVNLIINNERGTSYFRCSNFCGWEGAPYHNKTKDDGTRKIEYVKYAEVCKCNGMLLVRKNSSDGSLFLGCSSYPSCRETKNIPKIKITEDIELNIVNNLKGINTTRCGVYYMNEYVPEDKRKFYDDESNNFSKRLLGFKNDIDDYSVNLFSKDLIEFIKLVSENKFNNLSKIALIAVPSSKADKINNSMKKSIDLIVNWYKDGKLESAFEFDKEIINCKNLLKRVKDVPTAHLGEGRASCEEHIDSIECSEENLSSEDIAYIVLDDITTTGDTMKACNEVLLENGVNNKHIFNIAIGATVWDENGEI